MYKICLLLLLIMTSCYQIHSDDDMRTVPVTNNPNLIKDAKGLANSVGY